ncbi:hypothetical protein AWB81_03757 [Caballeronia arationis]|jgi:hypothetical protein|uniref:Uncharacterized protein n=1 Tax=Caballeronia arationis TaxID=1777142 RepID=A0A7Z7N7B1_9BURK|nr:hypothetical protein [Caballeronia arationis]SAK77733.1 hypothetical protein AWB81_03757 [Caballeronia arationis]SOE88799.1 hypothetical protein SAMN05446927_7422 [Caballeronia arationis]
MTADLDERVTRRLSTLRAWCRKEGIDVTPGGEISEEAATRAVGYRGTEALAVQRAEGRLSPLLRVRRLGRSYLYDLASCALFVETGYDAMIDENVTRRD